MASWLAKIKIKQTKHRVETKQRGFYILLTVGIAVCIPQLLRPLRHDKLFLRQGAQWISGNTSEHDLIAVSDSRLGFYAERSYIPYDEHSDRKDTKYAAIVLKADRIATGDYSPPARPVVFSLERKDSKAKLVIYGPAR